MPASTTPSDVSVWWTAVPFHREKFWPLPFVTLLREAKGHLKISGRGNNKKWDWANIILETVNSLWAGAVGFPALEWHLAAAPCVCLSLCLCQMLRPVVRSRECNSYLPARPAQAPTHSCSPYSQYHTQHLSACVCLCACLSTYVCEPAGSHTQEYFRACERSNLRGSSFPVHTSVSAC